jgi:hypothetical protein
MATWNDIEITLNQGTLEDQDRATLEAFSRVEPPPPQNPAFHLRFQQAQERIRRRLAQIGTEDLHRLVALQDRSKNRPDEHWYKKPVGIVSLVVAGTTVALIIRAALMHWFPQWFR